VRYVQKSRVFEMWLIISEVCEEVFNNKW